MSLTESRLYCLSRTAANEVHVNSLLEVVRIHYSRWVDQRNLTSVARGFVDYISEIALIESSTVPINAHINVHGLKYPAGICFFLIQNQQANKIIGKIDVPLMFRELLRTFVSV